MENEISIDYNTANMVFNTFVNGELKKIYTPPAMKEDVKLNALILGEFFNRLETKQPLIVAKDYEAHLQDILETMSISKFNEINNNYVDRYKTSMDAMLERVLSGAYVVEYNEVKPLASLKLNEDMKGLLKGFLLVFIVILRYAYSIGAIEKNKLSELGLVLTSLNATDYASSLMIHTEDNATSIKSERMSIKKKVS